MIMRFLWHWLVLTLGLYLLALIGPLGITFDTRGDLFWAALVLIFVNAVIKPILILFTLPLVLLTLGLFLLVINAVILYLLPHVVHGFHVPSFTSAFFGSLLLSLITAVFGGGGNRRRRRRMPRVGPRRSGNVIDV
jgi:putative membrane protein